MPATLNYFDLPGRAEATRIAFAMGGVEFKDKRLSFEEFVASPFSHLPVLQVRAFLCWRYGIWYNSVAPPPPKGVPMSRC